MSSRELGSGWSVGFGGLREVAGRVSVVVVGQSIRRGAVEYMSRLGSHRAFDLSGTGASALLLGRNATHIVVRCGNCTTTVVDHKGEDIGKGLLRRNERDLEPCPGKGWLKR
jgi:hypothetical protein